MSYILDALRKSEQQRQNGSPPTLSAAPAHANCASPKKTAALTYGLIAFTLLGVGVWIGWLRPWQKEQAPPTSNLATPQLANPATLTSPTTQQAPEPIKAGTSPTPSPAQQPDNSPKTAPKNASQSSTTQPKQQQPFLTATHPETQIGLPTPAQPDLPNITITVHAYSADPKERLAGINGRLWIEGNEIAPGLRLERITEDGVILNFKGRRFRRSLQ